MCSNVEKDLEIRDGIVVYYVAQFYKKVMNKNVCSRVKLERWLSEWKQHLSQRAQWKNLSRCINEQSLISP
jgi:hypothetical protein